MAIADRPVRASFSATSIVPSFRLDEDDHAFGFFDLEDALQHLQLLAIRGEDGSLPDGFDGHRLRLDRDASRVVQVMLRDASDWRRQSRREQRDLAFVRDVFEHKLHVFEEAHVEHLVGFIEYKALDLAEIQRLLVDVVDNATWRSNHDLRHAFQVAELRAVLGTAVDAGCSQASHVLAVLLERRSHLLSQLAGRSQNKNLWLATAEFHHRENRQSKRRCLAGTCLRLSQNIAAIQHVRNDAFLNLSRLVVAELSDRFLNLFAKRESSETGWLRLFDQFSDFGGFVDFSVIVNFGDGRCFDHGCSVGF